MRSTGRLTSTPGDEIGTLAEHGGLSSALLYNRVMDIEMTDDARKVLEKKGGTMSIDFIRPTG